MIVSRMSRLPVDCSAATVTVVYMVLLDGYKRSDESPAKSSDHHAESFKINTSQDTDIRIFTRTS